MMCVRCKKRPAIVFMQRMDNMDEGVGYCLTCAKELGIKPLDDIMKKFNFSDNDLANMEEKFMGFMNEGGFSQMSEMGMPDFDREAPDDFEPGGSVPFPLGMPGREKEEKEKPDKNEARDKAKKDKRRRFLDTYCTNLTAKARRGELDNVIGRDREIERCVQILCRRQKNNPCLIGEPGVGKTAIVEGIALRIADNNVPSRLTDREIYLLDLAALVAGTQFRGQFEQRVKGLVTEVRAAKNIILFIDEIHSLTGTGDAEGSMNAANILKPSLSRGEIQVIGATTFKEYRKFIEKDGALERRFQPVTADEPSIDETISVLEGVKSYYEEHHGVVVTSPIVKMAVHLSERYITERFLPDKAIDLLDEAAACCHLRNPIISELMKLKQQIDELENRETALEATAEKEEDFAEIATVRSERIKLEQDKSELEPKCEGIEVEPHDLAHVIELWTGIPAVKVEEGEFTKLSNLEENLKKHIIGQDEAVSAVAQAVKRGRVSISGRKAPVSFIFVGPTGVGKTELCRQLSMQLFDGVEPFIRLDMSEYMEKHAVSRIIGSPPGYVGYDESGQLTEKVRRRPYCVILFDEIEKAHPDMLNILLQVLDEGHITDSSGRTVNFANTIIIMTSNAGSSDKSGEVGFGKTAGDMSKTRSEKALSDLLRPEFLARVDDVIHFNPLTDEALEDIVKLMLTEYSETLLGRGVVLEYSDDLPKYIVEHVDGKKYGARELRRTLRKKFEDKIVSVFVDGFTVGKLFADVKDDEIMIKIN